MENKVKIHQSFFKWLITFVVVIIVLWFCYSNRDVSSSSVYQACIWIAVLGLGLGLIAMIGTCIWFLFAKSVLTFDFNQKTITVKNPVLFRKNYTIVRFDEISKISISKISVFRMIDINVKEPHEKSGVTNNGMTVSANLYLPTKKSVAELNKVLDRLKLQLNLK